MSCEECGAELIAGTKYCTNCGVELRERTPGNNDQSQDPPGFDFAPGTPLDESKTFYGGIHHPWRRFFARTVDLCTGAMIGMFLFFVLVGLFLPQSVDGFVKAMENSLVAGVVIYLLWLPVEAAFLSTIGTTPAKWVFGIRVLRSNGDKLLYLSALKRTFLLWFQGEGLGIPFITFFTRLFAYRRLSKTGTTHWDKAVESVVTHEEWGAGRAIASTLSVVVALLILGLLKTAGIG